MKVRIGVSFFVITVCVFISGQFLGFEAGYKEAIWEGGRSSETINLAAHGESIYTYVFFKYLWIVSSICVYLIGVYLQPKAEGYLTSAAALCFGVFNFVTLLFYKVEVLQKSNELRYPYHNWLVYSSWVDAVCLTLVGVFLVHEIAGAVRRSRLRD